MDAQTPHGPLVAATKFMMALAVLFVALAPMLIH